jgi:ParB family chromosome partitioning protein
MRELHARVDERLSPNPDERLDLLLAMNDADLLELLAVCVGASIDARISQPTERTKARGIAEAVELNMSAHWSATASTYFGHVTKKLILEAVGEFSPDSVNRLSALKRKDMAEEAERLARGTGWLPPPLRRPLRQHAIQRGTSSSSADDAIDGISCGHADDADVAVADDKLEGDREAEREAA